MIRPHPRQGGDPPHEKNITYLEDYISFNIDSKTFFQGGAAPEDTAHLTDTDDRMHISNTTKLLFIL